MKYLEAVALSLVVAGFVLFVSGMWLVWDLMNTIVANINWDEFCKSFRFPAPFFIYVWTCKDWTGAFDLGLTLAGIGIIAAIVGAYFIGYTRE